MIWGYHYFRKHPYSVNVWRHLGAPATQLINQMKKSTFRSTSFTRKAFRLWSPPKSWKWKSFPPAPSNESQRDDELTSFKETLWHPFWRSQVKFSQTKKHKYPHVVILQPFLPTTLSFKKDGLANLYLLPSVLPRQAGPRIPRFTGVEVHILGSQAILGILLGLMLGNK